MRPIVILACGWALFVLYAYPGTMTEEAFASAGALHVVWRALDAVVVAPFSIVALQSLAWLAGVHRIALRFASLRAAALAAGGSLLCPPVLGGLSTVSSHALAVALAAGAGGLALGRLRWLAAAPLAFAVWLVATAGDATPVTERARLVAAGIAWSRTPLQRGLAHVAIAPRGAWLWLVAAATLAAAVALARRFSPRAAASDAS